MDEALYNAKRPEEIAYRLLVSQNDKDDVGYFMHHSRYGDLWGLCLTLFLIESGKNTITGLTLCLWNDGSNRSHVESRAYIGGTTLGQLVFGAGKSPGLPL